jgi:hypothetical protein
MYGYVCGDQLRMQCLISYRTSYGVESLTSARMPIGRGTIAHGDQDREQIRIGAARGESKSYPWHPCRCTMTGVVGGLASGAAVS